MRTNKTGIIATTIITLALLAILSVISWAIPFPNHFSGTFIAAYVFAMIMVLLAGILILVVLFLEKDRNQKILGLPIIHFAITFAVVQVVISIIFYVINSLVEHVPAWIVILIESLILVITIILVTFGFFFKERTKDFKNSAEKTRTMDLVKAKMEIATGINKDESVKRRLEDLNYSIKGSDPVTNDMCASAEIKLLDLVDQLKEMLEGSPSSQEVLELALKIENALKERNTLCKAGKR